MFTGKRKIISFILAVFTLLNLVAVITGCDNKPAENTDRENVSAESGGADESDDSANEEKGPIKYSADYLPEETFGGYEFRMVAPKYTEYPGFWADATEENGETVNDAIYKRNRIIEERYDILFKEIAVDGYEGLLPLFQKSIKAGSDDFDLCMLISREAWAAALEGYVVPVPNLPYLDITQPWYVHDVNNQMTINNKLYFAYSDECLNMLGQTICILFNKKMAQDFEIGDIYSYVRNGQWTQDKFFEYAKIAAKDMDGDGTMTKEDRYGIISRNDMFYPYFWVGSGVKTLGKDENDLLVFTGNTEKLFTILEKTYQNVFTGDKIYFEDATMKMFEDDLALFCVSDITSIPSRRGMETDFGIIPFPKYDEAQDKYYSRVIDGWIHCVPNFSTNLQRTSIIMEALAVESKNITMPAYYEVALRGKHARDEESLEMLELISATRTMDLGDTFYYSTVREAYMSVFTKGQNAFQSNVEKKLPVITKALDKANEAALLLN